MANIKLDGGYNALPISYKRGNPIPLDTTSVWYNEEELKSYAQSGATSYVGQVLSLVDKTSNIATAYIIINTAGDLEPIGTAPVGDNATITVSESGEVALKGFAEADAETQLIKGADGKLQWVAIDKTTAAGQAAAIESLQQTVGKAASEGKEATGLIKDIADINANIEAMDAAYKAADTETLNSAKSHVATVIDGLKVSIEAKEGVDYIVVKSGDKEISSVNASKFVQDSFLDDVNYDATTGKITFTWSMGDGSQKTDEIDVSKLVDTYTAGDGLTLSDKNEFAVDTTKIATITSVTSAVEDATTTLTGKIDAKVDSTTLTSEIQRIEKKIFDDIESAIEAALEVEGVEKYATAASVTGLTTRVTTAESDIADLKGAKHTHANREELDKVQSGDVSKWDVAAGKAHVHKQGVDVLDTVTAEKIAAWDNAKSEAISYADRTFATKAQGETAENAIQELSIAEIELNKNNSTITKNALKSALDLGSAAYEDTTAFDAAGSAAAVKTNLEGQLSTLSATVDTKVTLSEVQSEITKGAFAKASDLNAHTTDTTKHVSDSERGLWNAAAAKVQELTGDDLGSGSSSGGINAMIDDKINIYNRDTITPALNSINSDLDAILGTDNGEDHTDGRLDKVEKQASETKTNLATTDQKVAKHGEDIAAAKSAITTLQTDSALHALKSDVEDELDKKANLSDYNTTAATVAELKTTVDNFFNKEAAVNDTIDTLKEIANYIATDKEGAADITARVGSLEGKVDTTKKVSEAIADAVLVETNRATGVEAGLSTRIKDLEDNKAGYATVEQVNAAKTAVTTDVTKYVDDEIKELTDGAIKDNADDIAANSAAITTLTTTKADSKDVYLKAETYTQDEVDALINKLTEDTSWGTF